MKFSLSWLKTHLETEASLQEITDTLTSVGLELESVTDRGAPLAPFVIAQVLEAAPHPNADRLRACKVDIGTGETISVVCGAPNARTGMKAVFAPPGSTIPATGAVLKRGEIRGVESAGMLLSIREMALGDDHEGIVDLPDDAPVGLSYAAYARLDDPIIDIAITPNRGDALSVRGIARDLAAAGRGTLLPFAPKAIPATIKSRLHWQLDWPDACPPAACPPPACPPPACPWILGRTIRNLRNPPSPPWLQERLLSIGLRPINTLVDITNFFTIDLGRPLHVFDANKVQGDTLTLRPGNGETFRALNGRDYTARPEDCVIADAAGVQSLAGVIGGAATGCDADTREVFVECALFDPVRVAMTGRHHAIISDARTRFERGIDPSLPPAAIEAATAMILALCGGDPSEIVSAGAEPPWPRTATLRFHRLAEFGGLDVPPDEAIRDLERLGFTQSARTNASITVHVPAWRNDIAGAGLLEPWPDLPAHQAAAAALGRDALEPEADLIEEILRLRGLDAIPPVSMPISTPLPQPTLTPKQTRTAIARRVLAARGHAECVTFSFMPSAQAANFAPPDPALRLENPIAADLDAMRPTPLATLAAAAARNAARFWPDIALFEVGPAYTPPRSAPDRRRNSHRPDPPATGPPPPARSTPSTPRPTRWPSSPPSACRWTPSPPPRTPPAFPWPTTTPTNPALSAKAPKPSSPPSAPSTPNSPRPSTSPPPSPSKSTSTPSPNPNAANAPPPTSPPCNPCAATSPSSSPRTPQPTPSSAPRAAPSEPSSPTSPCSTSTKAKPSPPARNPSASKSPSNPAKKP